MTFVLMQYTSWDNLLGTDYEEEEEKQKELAKAPRTIEYGDELVRVLLFIGRFQSYFFVQGVVY